MPNVFIAVSMGKFIGMKGPGIFFIVPIIDSVSTYVDQRVRVNAFKAEQTLTKDTVPVNVDAVVYWTVWDVEKAALEVQDYQEAIEHIAQTGLRDTIGKHELSTLLQERDKIAEDLQVLLDQQTSPWGITCQTVGIKDIAIPPALAEAMERLGLSAFIGNLPIRIQYHGQCDSRITLRRVGRQPVDIDRTDQHRQIGVSQRVGLRERLRMDTLLSRLVKVDLLVDVLFVPVQHCFRDVELCRRCCQHCGIHDWRDLSLFKSTLYFMYPYGDTIYSIDNKDNIKRLYSIDFGDKSIPADLFDEKGDELALEKKTSKLEDYMHATAFSYTDKYIYIGSYNKVYQGFFTLYSKMNKHTLTAHKLIDDMFLKGNVITISIKNLPRNTESNDILFPLDPEYLINGYKHYMSYLSDAGREEFRKKYPELVRICTTLKEDDNPVILRIKVKDF